MPLITPRAEDVLYEMSVHEHIVDDVEVALQEGTAGIIDRFDELWIAEGDAVWSDSDCLAMLSVKSDLETVRVFDVVEAPEVCKVCERWARKFSER